MWSHVNWFEKLANVWETPTYFPDTCVLVAYIVLKYVIFHRSQVYHAKQHIHLRTRRCIRNMVTFYFVTGWFNETLRNNLTNSRIATDLRRYATSPQWQCFRSYDCNPWNEMIWCFPFYSFVIWQQYRFHCSCRWTFGDPNNTSIYASIKLTWSIYILEDPLTTAAILGKT